jgi:hypothetical protein
MTIWEKISLILTAIGFYNCCRFAWVYQLRSRGKWRVSPHGRYMMATSIVVGSLLGLILSNKLFPEWPGRQFVALALYFCYLAFTGWLNRILDISLPDPGDYDASIEKTQRIHYPFAESEHE